jgi:Xaa-Pro aminopeptidase
MNGISYRWQNPILNYYSTPKLPRMKKIYWIALCIIVSMPGVLTPAPVTAQEALPTDYLSASFHAGRRDALRKLMPANSVAIIFAYPERVFSNDVNYPYHPNPDLYYFSGYLEPNAVLLIFKEPQTGAGHNGYNELFFIQKKDPAQEQWTGRRMGIEKVKTGLGFDSVFNGSEFSNYPIDLSRFDKILFAPLPSDLHDDLNDSADIYDLVQAFKRKAGLQPGYDGDVSGVLDQIIEYSNPKNLERFKDYFRTIVASNEKFRSNGDLKDFMLCADSAALQAFKQKILAQKWSSAMYTRDIAALREIKTSEEMDLMRKTVSISCIAHAEVMKAIRPGMSEAELQGLQEYVHKKLGAEYVGYPSIVGAGANGCILHYEENTKTHVGRELVLMDIGAQYHGYSADVTRTVPSTGKFSPEQKAIYDLVYQAQEEIFKLCHEGTPFGKLNEKATETLAAGLIKLGIIADKKNTSLYYPHGCSHFLGLDVHDVGNYNQSLKENMVITVEPGIYIPAGSACDKKWWDIGVRIEDDVRIGKDSPELLSYLAPRKSEDVEKMAAMGSVFKNLALPVVK